MMRRAIRTGSVLAALLIAAAPAAAQAPDSAQLDSLRTEAVRMRGFIRAAETQANKFIAALDSLRADDAPADTIIVPDPDPEPEQPPDSIVEPPPPPPDSTEPPEPLPPAPADARAFLIGPQTPIGTSPWPNFDVVQESDLVKWAGRYLADQPGGDTYYDLPWALYQLHARTGDPAHLELAQAVAAKYWAELAVSTGWTQKPDPFSVAPRTLPFAGLLLYMLEGGGLERQTFTNRHNPDWSAQYSLPEWLEGWLRSQYPNWLGRRLQNDHLWAGLRDGSMLLTAITQAAAAWPDSADRAEFRQMALDAAVQYYARLQYPDGSWRWNPGSGATEIDGASQPFQVALQLEALATVHQLTGDTTVLRALARGGEAWFRDTYDTTFAVPHLPDTRVRGALYISYGGICDPPIQPSMPQCGNDVASASGSWQASNKIKVIRHRNTFAPFPLAYTCHVTTDERFCDWASEVFAATYGGELGGPGADGLSAVMPAMKGKEANQLFRTAGRALWYLAN